MPRDLIQNHEIAARRSSAGSIGFSSSGGSSLKSEYFIDEHYSPAQMSAADRAQHSPIPRRRNSNNNSLDVTLHAAHLVPTTIYYNSPASQNGGSSPSGDTPQDNTEFMT